MSSDTAIYDGSDCSYIYEGGIQVGTISGAVLVKWKSSGLSIGDRIPVDNVENDEPWILERNRNNPWWSFFIKTTDGEKLYVTYDNDDTVVSLQPEETGPKTKMRSFFAFLQPDGKYALSSKKEEGSPLRFLGVLDGFLTMTDAENPEGESDWIIAPRPVSSNSQNFTCYFYIRDGGKPTEKWISSNARRSDRVPVASTSYRQEWALIGSDNGSCFKVPETGFYASRNDSETEITFELTEIAADRRVFDLVRHGKFTGPGVLLQARSNKFFIGKEDGRRRSLLELKEEAKEATKWVLQVTRVGWVNERGEIVVFPMFETKSID